MTQLEQQLQTELLLPHISNQTRDRAEARRARNVSVVRIREVRMVQSVERLPAELQPKRLGDSEVLKQAQVEIDETGPAQEVARCVAIGVQRRQRECVDVHAVRQLAAPAVHFYGRAGEA